MKVLIIRMMGFGDVASILIPAVKYVRQQYLTADIDVLTFGAGVELMSLSTDVNAVLAVSKAQWPDDFNEAVPNFMHLAELIIAQQYDLVVNLDTWFMPCFLARVIKDAGVNLQGNYINVSVVTLYNKIQSKHISQDYFQHTANYLASTYPNMADWSIHWWDKFTDAQGYPAFYLNHCCGFVGAIDISMVVASDAAFLALAKGKKIIAVSSKGSKASKQYPFHEALVNLLEKHGYFVWSGFTDQSPIQVTLSRLKVTDLLITVATSTQWLAKLVGCPALLISGPLPPEILAAEMAMEKTHDCQFCAKTVCEKNIDFACMQVPPEQVLKKVQAYFTQQNFSFSEAENDLIHLFINQKFAEVETQIIPLLEMYPDWLNGWKILSDTLLIQNKDAKVAAFKALALNHLDAEAHCYVGLLLQKEGDLIGAEQAFTQAILLKPNYAAAHNNLGIVKKDLGDVETGILHFQEALKINPNYASCFSNLLFCLSHFENIDAKTLYQAHVKFSAQYERPTHWPRHLNNTSPNRALKIGFVSADFRDHSVAYCLAPLLNILAQSNQLVLFAYYNHTIVDAYTQQLQTQFKQWRNVTDDSDAAFCKQVRADGIDILIDLSGHTAGNRLTAFAMKPAPVQATWFGYLTTTGLKAMDYYLADAFLAPPHQFDAMFSEKIVHLPINANFMPLSTASEIANLPALKNGYLTFGCFNRPSKMSPATIALWSTLLKALPNAKLLLGAMPQQNASAKMLAAFQSHGIHQHQLILHTRGDLNAYFSLHHQVDICLDTQPSSGITTTLHAAWMGVPTLCLAGNSVTSRGAMAIMSHLALHNFIVKDALNLVEKSQYWANNLHELNQIRCEMRLRFNASNIAKPALLANGLLHAFRHMWHIWCGRKAKKSFTA